MIIESLLDTDLYKFTMMQIVFHQFKDADVKYRFICRTPNIDFTPIQPQLEKEIEHLCQLRLSADELNYLKQLPYMKEDFVDQLASFQLSTKHIDVTYEKAFNLVITGPWYNTILFEVPLLAIINELYYKSMAMELDDQRAQDNLKKNISALKNDHDIENFSFIDFGTRRRFSKGWHETLIASLIANTQPYFTGTSNIYFAKKYNIPAAGTMAHEYIQACQAIAPDLRDSQRYALQHWLEEYPHHLGIALADTYGMPAFIKDFDANLSQRYVGVRLDSGNPHETGEIILEHFRDLNIDAKNKTIVFSDQLTMAKALKLYHQYHERCKLLFGIGTHLTNHVGYKPLDIVIKMVACNGQPVAKISASPDKVVTEDHAYLHKLIQIFSK